MKLKKVFIIALLFFSFSSISIYSQNADNAVKLYNSGEYEKAAIEFEKVLPDYRKEYGLLDTNFYASILNLLGESYYLSDQYLKSAHYLNESKKIFESHTDTLNPRYLSVLCRLAPIYHKTHNIKEEEKILLKLFYTESKKPGKTCYKLEGILSLLSNLFLMQGDITNAQKFSPTYIKHEEKAIEYFLEEKYDSAAFECELAIPRIENLYGNYDTISLLRIILCAANSYNWGELDVNMAIHYFNRGLKIYKHYNDTLNPSYIVSLIKLGILYYKTNYFIEAKNVLVYALALEKFKNGYNSSQYYSILANLAIVYAVLEEYDSATIAANEIQEAFDSGVDYISFQELVKVLNSQALIYVDMGQYNLANNLLQNAARISKMNADTNSRLYSNTINNLGHLNDQMGNYFVAKNYYLKAETISRNCCGEDNSWHATILDNLAQLYFSIGLYNKSEKQFIKAQEIYSKNSEIDPIDYAISIESLAALYGITYNWEEIEPLLKRALIIKKKHLGPFHREYAKSLHNMGQYYSMIGQYKKAIPFLEEALFIIQENYSNFPLELYTIADYQYALATTYLMINKEDKFDSIIHKSIGSIESLDNHENDLLYADLNILCAYTHLNKDEYNAAGNHIMRAVEITENQYGRFHIEYADKIRVLADFLAKIGKYDDAINYMYESINIYDSLLEKNHLSLAKAYDELAILLYETKYNPDSLAFLANQIRIKHIKNTETYLTEKERLAYLVSLIKDMEVFFNLSIYREGANREYTTINFNNVIFTKNLLQKSHTSLIQSINQSENDSLVDLHKKYLNVNNKIAKLYKNPTINRKLIDSLFQAREIIEKSLRKESVQFGNSEKITNTELSDIANNLSNNETAIEFFNFNYYYYGEWLDTTYYFALLFHKGNEYPKMVYLFEERELQNAISSSSSSNPSELVSSLYGQSRGAKAINPVNISFYGDSLYKLIWEPLDSLLDDVEKVYYSPSGLLHNISFAAIPTSDSTLLCDDYDLSLMSTTANIVLNEEPNVKNLTVAIYGGITYDMTQDEMISEADKYKEQIEDLLVYNRGLGYSDTLRGGSWNYLKGTLSEAENVSATLKSNNIITTIYTGASANEESFKALSGRNSPGIIHLATHGFFFPDPEKKERKKDLGFQTLQEPVYSMADNPLIRSGLIMAGGNAAWKGEDIPDELEDGILTAYEVSGLDLFNTQLVTLSACETGLGDIQGTEGVYGLQRAFKMAGVDYLIMSLWQVPDNETTEFMDLFYSNWTGGQSIGNAFRSTQRSMRQKYDPFYWAGFVLLE